MEILRAPYRGKGRASGRDGETSGVCQLKGLVAMILALRAGPPTPSAGFSAMLSFLREACRVMSRRCPLWHVVHG
jgi:hypothetical protein